MSDIDKDAELKAGPDEAGPGEAGGEGLTSSLAEGESDSGFVTSEPTSSQRGSVMVLLLLAAVGAGVVYFMYHRKHPATAAGATVQATQANQTIKDFLDSGPTGMRLMEQMLRNTEKVVRQFLQYPSMAQIPLSDLKTNPFRSSQAPVADSQANEKKRKEEERLAVLKAVQTLQLQSIMSGTRKACMINNTLYQEGQQVGSFTIEKISPSTVIVKRATYRFELKMQK